MWIADVGRIHLRRRIVSTRREPRLGLRGPSGLLSPAVEGSCQETNFGSASLRARSISSSSGVRVREPLTGRAWRHSVNRCAMAPFSVHHLAELRSWARPRLRARHQALRASCCRGSLHWDSSAGAHPSRSSGSTSVSAGRADAAPSAGARALVPGRRCRGREQVRQRHERSGKDPSSRESAMGSDHGDRESGAGEHPRSILAKASRANDPTTWARSVQRELRGRAFRNPH